MPDKKIAAQHHATFENIRHIDAEGNEYWLARQIAKVLEYSEFRHFQPVIERAREACLNSAQPVVDHFEDVLAMVDIGSGAKREVADVRLSRYACYLIVQNGDPSKPVIANGQTYFAMQTRRQELADDEKFARLPCYADRGEAEARQGARQAERQPDPLRGGEEGAPDDSRTGRHYAGSLADTGGKHQTDRKRQEEVGEEVAVAGMEKSALAGRHLLFSCGILTYT